MSGHLHDKTSLYYITSFVKRYISKTSSLLLTIQVIHHVNNTITAFHRYYYMQRITTNIFNSHMQLVRQRLHGFINPRPPLKEIQILETGIHTSGDSNHISYDSQPMTMASLHAGAQQQQQQSTKTIRKKAYTLCVL